MRKEHKEPIGAADVNRACDRFFISRGEAPLTWGACHSQEIRLAKIRKRIRNLEAGEGRSAVEIAAMELEGACQ